MVEKRLMKNENLFCFYFNSFTMNFKNKFTEIVLKIYCILKKNLFNVVLSKGIVIVGLYAN